MRLTFLLSVIIVSAFSALSQGNKDDAAIRAVVNRLVIAQTDYDQKTIDTLLTPDYIEISPLGELDPRDKVIGFYASDQKPDPAKMTATVEVTEFSIRVYGNVAVAIARFNYAMTAGGDPLPPRSIRATIVLKKERDWKIASAQYTSIRPPSKQQKTN